MAVKRFSIIFCGGCNPKINRGRIADELGSALAGQGHQVSCNTSDADFIIYLSGCSVGCARRKHKAGTPSMEVAGTSIDSITMEEKVLVVEILKRGGHHFGKF